MQYLVGADARGSRGDVMWINVTPRAPVIIPDRTLRGEGSHAPGAMRAASWS